MYQERSGSLRGLCQQSRRESIHLHGGLFVGLCLVDIGVRRAVDDHINISRNGIRVSYVELQNAPCSVFQHICEHICVSGSLCTGHHLCAQLTFCSCYQYLHFNSDSLGCFLSFSDSIMSSAGILQSMAMSGSSHATAPSVSGA